VVFHEGAIKDLLGGRAGRLGAGSELFEEFSS